MKKIWHIQNSLRHLSHSLSLSLLKSCWKKKKFFFLHRTDLHSALEKKYTNLSISDSTITMANVFSFFIIFFFVFSLWGGNIHQIAKERKKIYKKAKIHWVNAFENYVSKYKVRWELERAVTLSLSFLAFTPLTHSHL